MSMASGSFQSVVGGVSQQAAHKRKDGQMEEVINFVCDPLRGLARRQGMRRVLTGPAVQTGLAISDALSYQAFEYSCAGKDYVVLYPKVPLPGGRESQIFCFTKDHVAGITNLPANMALTDTDRAAWAAVQAHGISAIAQIGDVLIIAPNNFPAAHTETSRLSSGKVLVHVRGGQYSRTYKLFGRLPGVNAEVSYTTMAASYPGVLDTSDIASTDPDYQKKVNDRVHAYNTAVTQWTGQAAASIQPENIATQLESQLLALGIPGNTIFRHGAYLYVENMTEVSASDGGDGTLMAVVSPDIANPALLPAYAVPGFVARHAAAGQTVAYYEALAINGQTQGLVPVQWKETAGTRVTITQPFVTCFADGTKFHIGDIGTATAGVIKTPTIMESRSGDTEDGSNLPPFLGRQISMLAVFQDRLLVGAGNTLTCSVTGDYLNFFQASALGVAASDPIYFEGLSDDNDTLRYSTNFDRNLLIFGERKQYVISGRSAMDARNPLVTTASSYEETTQCKPVMNGNFAFFSKPGRGASSLHQFQLGSVSDTIQSYEVSEMLDTYIKGTILEMAAVTAPNFVFMRSTGLPHGLYVYTYLDTQAGEQRVFSSMSQWQWDMGIGFAMGVTAAQGGGLLVFALNEGVAGLETNARCINVHWLPIESAITGMPYMDGITSARALNDFGVGTTPDRVIVDQQPHAWQPAAAYPAEASVYGVPFESSVTLTNPYMKDYQGNAKLSGRLVIQRYLLRLQDTGGIGCSINYAGEDTELLSLMRQQVGALSSMTNTQPIVDTTLSIPCGRANDEFLVTAKSRKWLPLTISSIEWAGQYFNHRR